ncbi:radical SAM protein [Planctomycetota bacterium]|nr:radical SAM protein [Planctomycetota bacterium]
MLLNLARTIPRSAANGPGQRFVIWVQGCAIRCPGCWNPDTWTFATRQLRDTAALADEIVATSEIEGVTLTGGEPFHQARALVDVASRVRAAGLSVFVFTGYDLHELNQSDHCELLALTDVLVSGRYVQSLRSFESEWRGSTNQRVHFLSARYTEASMADSAHVEFHLAPDGELSVTGFPLPQLLDVVPAPEWPPQDQE